jgi:hypothetical protein
MRVSKLFAIAVISGVFSGCGGADPGVGAGAQQQPQAALQFVVDYLFISPFIFPNGTIQVSPFPGKETIGIQPIAKVELLLFGQDRHELTAANFSPKDNPQLRYVFGVPATFVSGLYPCGTGAYLSEVRVTDVNGLMLSKTFELCPGTTFQASAASQ